MAKAKRRTPRPGKVHERTIIDQMGMSGQIRQPPPPPMVHEVRGRSWPATPQADPGPSPAEHFVPDETDLQILQAYHEIGRAAVGAEVAAVVGKLSRNTLAPRIKMLRQAGMIHHRRGTRGDGLTDKGRKALLPHLD